MGNHTIKAIIPALWQDDSTVTAAFSTKPDSGYIENDYSLAYSEYRQDRIIEQNRRDWLRELGLGHTGLALGKQVHGSEVKIVTDAIFQNDTDGLVTHVKNLTLGILVADCAAVLLADRSNGIISAVHAGWRGAISGIIGNAIKKMTSLGGDLTQVEAFVSPCISLQAFEVGKEVAQRFPDEYVDYHSYDKPHINLKAFLVRELTKSGLTESNIESHEACTVGRPESFHSFRRDKEKSGRMMAVISLG